MKTDSISYVMTKRNRTEQVQTSWVARLASQRVLKQLSQETSVKWNLFVYWRTEQPIKRQDSTNQELTTKDDDAKDPYKGIEKVEWHLVLLYASNRWSYGRKAAEPLFSSSLAPRKLTKTKLTKEARKTSKTTVLYGFISPFAILYTAIT